MREASIVGPVTAFFLHSAAALHDTGWGHPEHQGRLRALASSVGKDLLALHGRVEQMEGDLATDEDLLAIHTPELIERVRRAVDEAESSGQIVSLDPDTRVSAASWEAALGSAGCLIRAVEGVARGEFRNAFVATRPPGHHATRSQAMGFCLFNHVAIGARAFQRAGLGERALIVDWDVHHGNGTQDIFYDDPTVFYLSIHQSPHWPGTGTTEERGDGPGLGMTLNVPLPAGTPRDAYRKAFSEALSGAVADFTPDLVLVSSGFDVLAGDPLGGQLIEPEDLHDMVLEVVSLAEEWCNGRVVVALEGGYDPRRTGLGAVAVIRALAGVPYSV